MNSVTKILFSVGYLLHLGIYHLAHRWHDTRFYGACRTYADFLHLVPILHRFRIVRRNLQAALHSALFNYTPLVICGDRQTYAANIVKPKQIRFNAINTLLHYKIIGAFKIFKNQPRPFLRPRSVNFCQHFFKSTS